MSCFKAADTLQIASLFEKCCFTLGGGIRQSSFLTKPFSAQTLFFGEHLQNQLLSLGQVYWVIYWVIYWIIQ